MLVAFCHKTLRCLLTEVGMLDESADFNITSIRIGLNRVARVQVTAVNVD